MDSSGKDNETKKSDTPGGRKGSKEAETSAHKDKASERSSREKRRPSASSTGASQPSGPASKGEESAIGPTPSKERRQSKSSAEGPEHKGSRPEEKGAPEIRPRKSSLRTTGNADAKLTTGKDAELSKGAAVEFSSNPPALETFAVDSLRKLVFPAAVLLVFVLVMCFTFFVGNYIPVPPAYGSVNTSSCPEESERVLRSLNQSFGPCDNFYAYVCSKTATTSNPDHFSPLMRRAVTSAFIRFANLGVRANDAGMLRASLDKHSRDGMVSPGGGLADYVNSIVNVTGLSSSSPMTIPGIVRFFVQLSLRYKLPGVVSFKVSEPESLLKLERNDGCISDLGNDTLMNASELRAINLALNTAVSPHDLKSVEVYLANLRGADDSFSSPVNITKSPFSALSDSEWRKITQDFVYPAYPAVTGVTQKAGDRLSQLISAFTEAPRPSHVLVYAVVCTAMRAHASVNQALVGPGTSPSCAACQALDVCEIEDTVVAAVTSAPCVDEYISSLFDRVRSSVIDYAEKHVLLRGRTKNTIASKLENASLALPVQMTASYVAAPSVSQTFAANLLSARSYGFDVRREKVARNIPGRESLFLPSAVRRGSVIYVSTHLYGLLSRSCPHKGVEFSTVGVELSFHLWSFLLEDFWPTEEQWKTEPHLVCLREMYGENSGHAGFRKKLTVALALDGTFQAEMAGKGQMLDVKGTQVPLDRYAFILWLYGRCSFMSEWLPRKEINALLKNVAAFASAFECPKPRTC